MMEYYSEFDLTDLDDEDTVDGMELYQCNMCELRNSESEWEEPSNDYGQNLCPYCLFKVR